MSEYPRLEPGQTAPAFTLQDHEGKPVSLIDFAGRKIVLYFYPAALTPGCTKESCEFNEALDSFESHGYAVVGVSPDEPAKLSNFKSKEGLGFPLLSDPDKIVHQAYGAYGEKSLYGRIYTGVLRSTFVIDEEGIVTEALYNVKATGHVAMLSKRLGL